MRNVEAVEDAVQSALMSALEKWKLVGLPENPSAWLFRVASNNLMGELRTRSGRLRILEQNAALAARSPESAPDLFLANDVRDDLLRMLFVCCDESIPMESQLVLSLKTLCGFGVPEIAQSLFTSKSNVYKRLGRARSRLRKFPIRTGELTDQQYASRLGTVHKVIYLMFTEGYLSSQAELVIRRELCEEAIRLGIMLAEHPVGRAPESSALVALMHLHLARMTSRQDRSGGLLLLEEQDRTLWDQQATAAGLEWLAKSAEVRSSRAITGRPESPQNTAWYPRSVRPDGTKWRSPTRFWRASLPRRSTGSTVRLPLPSGMAPQPGSKW